MDGFREWVVEHHGMVCATADEVTQETFLIAYQRRDQLADAERAGPWLRALARNQAVDRLRRRRMDARARAGSVGASARVAPTSGPEAAIAEALERLDDDSRALLLQFHLEGRTSQELADQWGVSDATLRKRLSRARATLRDEYRAELKRWASPHGVPVTDDAVANVATATEVTVRRGGEELPIKIPAPRAE